MSRSTPAASASGRAAAKTTRVAVANAPVSYGAFEMTVGTHPGVPGPIELLDHVARTGYEGIDLGPAGYLGSGEELAERLESRELVLAGGYLELPFSEPEALRQAMPALDELLDTFDSVKRGRVPPRPTLADAGSEERSEHPGQAAIDPAMGLDDDGWQRLAAGVTRALDRCRERGYEPTFHHHTATYVEAKWEIERLLDLTEIGLTLDTGHLLLGRGDPVEAVRDWADRINHVHLKDARKAVLEEIVARGDPVESIWKRRAFCRFGDGDVDVAAVLDGLRGIEYEGWIVVEQDVIPSDESAHADEAARDQEHNRAFLRRLGY
jgi:inosose dehydratase